MAATKGKVTTTTSKFIALGKEVMRAEGDTLRAWFAVFVEFRKNGGGSQTAFAEAFARVNKEWKATTVRQQLNYIARAEEEVKGGALACRSMTHLKATLAKDTKKEPAKARKVSTVTVNEDEFARALRKAGLSAEIIAIASKAVFTTTK